jgi:alpha-1,2-mannosyltransferase
MSLFWQQFESGAWLTRERARVYCLLLGGICAIAMMGWVALSDGLIDRNGKPIGTDFSSFYAAGSLVLDGKAGDVYDGAAHYAREQQIFGAKTPYYGWLYPPIFLFVATPLALMPYPLALALWQSGSLAFYLLVIGAILRKARAMADLGSLWLLVAAAFPAVVVNLGHGQNGFLTAGLFGAALGLLQRSPVLAGIAFALLSYKPQFILVIPFALAAAGQWRAIAAAIATAVVLLGITSLVFGLDLWWAFAASTDISRRQLLEQGDVGFEKLQSVFAAVRMWGGGVSLAYLVQGLVSVAVVCSAAWVWRVSDDRNVRAAILMVATLLASPHVLDYDLMIIGPAIAFMVSAGIAGGFRSYEISILVTAWIAPLLARSVAGLSGIPLGLLAVLALYTVILRRALHDRDRLAVVSRNLAQA